MQTIRRFLPLLLILLVGSSFAQNCTLRIGTNLAGPADWGAEWPFVNIMKYSRNWITFNSEWVAGGENPWDTGVLDQIPLDENGYPLELPYTVAGTETTQVVRTVWANTNTLKEGIYTVLYDGDGQIEIDFDGQILTNDPGRITFQMTRNNNILALAIMESTESNHIRNIRVLLPGTENTYEENPWTDEWLEKLEPFKGLRFMDWGQTNNSALQDWEYRPQMDDFTYTMNGIPYEWMIEICNLKQADAWVCVPHEADDGYIHEMARLFRDGLDPSLMLYAEYSNEIWNWMFDQTHYLFNNGDQGVEWPERIVPFIQNTLDIWTEEFAGQMDRLTRVVGVQASWQDVSNRVMFNMAPGTFDAFSPASYFGLTDNGYAALETLGSAATAEDVLLWAREAMLKESWIWMQDQTESIGQALDIPMIYYEGGQHLTPNPFGSEQPYAQALMDAQTHPGMYDLYIEWYDSLATLVPEGDSTLLMNFSFISSKDGKYGSWGVLESQFDQHPPYRDSAPKYQAILDYQCERSSRIEDATHYPISISLDAAYPNPFNAVTTLSFQLDRSEHVQISVYNPLGQTVALLLDNPMQTGIHHIRWDAGHLTSGLYIIRLTAGSVTRTQKCLLLK
ncbi:T9SS type A sorting domain-containing protein [candidate division KSB1 bacterium]|nr:T9SS type A sorting domain-containing protein [candidate division KSB1 bacterium]